MTTKKQGNQRPNAPDTSPPNIDRRTLLVVNAAAAGLGLKIPAAPAAAATPATTPMRIDAHTDFAPLKFLEFAEKAAVPADLALREQPRIERESARIDLLDRHGIDINVRVPVPWIEGFHTVYADPALAANAARLMNDELAAIVGVAILPVIDPEAMVAELHRAVTQLGFVGAYVAVGPTAKRMDHPDYEHLYKAMVELDATLWPSVAAADHSGISGRKALAVLRVAVGGLALRHEVRLPGSNGTARLPMQALLWNASGLAISRSPCATPVSPDIPIGNTIWNSW
jgi:hypothetical protein